MKKILILEDQKSLRETLIDYLSAKGFQCLSAGTYQKALSLLPEDFHVALIDIGLPDGNGLDFINELKSKKPQSIVLVLSALNDPNTRLQGLELGALDYITKPFELKELSLRLERILQTREELTPKKDKIIIGNLEILFSQYKVIDANGKSIELSQKESQILTLLYQNQNKTLSRDYIIDKVWGVDSYPSNRTVDNYIVKLRRWAETDQDAKLKIKSIRGIGYLMEII